MKTMAAVILATALAVSGWTYAIARPASVHNVTRTVTRVVREPSAARTVVRWKTRTVTVTKTAAAGSAAPCVEQNGTVVPAVGAAAAGAPGLTTCTLSIQPDVPSSGGDQLVITAPDGTSNSYQLGAPAVAP